MGLEAIAGIGQQREEVIDVAAVELAGHYYSCVFSEGAAACGGVRPVSQGAERGAITRRDSAASRRPRRQVLQSRAEDRCLHFIEARVDAELVVPIARGLSAVAQSPDAGRQLRVA